MVQVGTENCLNTMNGYIARRRSSINKNLSHMLLLAVAIFAAMVTEASAFVPPSSPRATVSIIGHPRNHNNANFREGNEFTTAESFKKSGKSTCLSDMKSDVVDAIGGTSMLQYFLKAVIDSSVPALFAIVTIGFAAFLLRKRSREEDEGSTDYLDNPRNAAEELYNDMYGESSSSSGLKRSMFGALPFGNKPNKTMLRNLGIPSTEYIKVTKLNDKYASYDFSLTKATASKAAAAAAYRSRAFDRALEMAVQIGEDLPAYAKRQLLEAEKKFVQKGKKLVGSLQLLEARLIQDRVDNELQKMGESSLAIDPKPLQKDDSSSTATNETSIIDTLSSTTTTTPKKSNPQVTGEISKLQKELQELELNFIQEAVAALGPERGVGIRSALIRDVAARGTGGLLRQLEDRPLSALLRQFGGSSDDSSGKKSLFVMKFPGDVTASQLNELREEVTAVVRNAKPGDEALLILQSGGGTVTGYGLAAGQLVRLREKGIFLTIAVEQVAASGGYMMCCVADRIIASPFAVLGSIGVISEIPNVYERLKQEGIEFQTVTAGEFKRTLTPTKKVTKEDVKKAEEDVNMILTQFSGFVQKNRPNLDVASVATGETWFGEAALDKGLCDEIKPVDDILLHYVDLGYNVFEIAYRPPPEVPTGLLAGLLPASGLEQQQEGFGAIDKKDSNLGRLAIRWLVNAVTEEVKASLVAQKSDVENRKYMTQDNTADRVQIKDRL